MSVTSTVEAVKNISINLIVTAEAVIPNTIKVEMVNQGNSYWKELSIVVIGAIIAPLFAYYFINKGRKEEAKDQEKKQDKGRLINQLEILKSKFEDLFVLLPTSETIAVAQTQDVLIKADSLLKNLKIFLFFDQKTQKDYSTTIIDSINKMIGLLGFFEPAPFKNRRDLLQYNHKKAAGYSKSLEVLQEKFNAFIVRVSNG